MNDDLQMANTRKIPMTQGKFALVDAEDYEWLSKYNWRASNSKSLWSVKRERREGGRQKSISMASEIMRPPIGAKVTFKNYDSLDCRKANMQIVSHSEAMQHREKLNKNKTSLYKGVFWAKANQKWRASIAKDGKRYYLGYFSDEEEAARTYDEKALELYGETASLNCSDNSGTPAVVNHKRLRPARKSNIGRRGISRRPLRKKTSQFKGVCWHKDARKWTARIKLEGKGYYLGCFAKEADAARAYDEAAVGMFGEGAYLNFPQKRLKHAQ